MPSYMLNCFTEILCLVCTENGITAVRSNKLITCQCLKKNCDMKDEIIDFTTSQVENTAKYFTTEAYRQMLCEGL